MRGASRSRDVPADLPADGAAAWPGMATALWLLAFALLLALLLYRNFVLGLPDLGVLRLGPLTIAPFGPLVSLGVLFGIHLMHRWSLRYGPPWEDLFPGVGWMLFVGFVGSHVLDVALYRPEDFFTPSVLLDFRSDYSSFGGLLCGGIAATVYCKRVGLTLLRSLECTLYGFTGGWLFGRLACFAVHDHPGVRTSFPLGVEIKGVPRHDLGFYELLYTIVVFAILQATTRRRRYDGYVVALVATTYAPVRFLLDFLRVRDATYAGLTPAQWACIPLLAIGLWYVREGLRARRGAGG